MPNMQLALKLARVQGEDKSTWVDELCTYHDSIVDKATSVTGWFEMRILFGAGDSDPPHLLPGLIQLHMDRVYP